MAVVTGPTPPGTGVNRYPAADVHYFAISSDKEKP
jgi:hypothetical protein